MKKAKADDRWELIYKLEVGYDRLYLRHQRTGNTWLVFSSQDGDEHGPEKIRSIMDDFEKRGVFALLDTNPYEVYTSRVRWSGYGFETIGLREALIRENPELRKFVDSEFYMVSWALPRKRPDGKVLSTDEAERLMGLRPCNFSQDYFFFSVFKREEIPKDIPSEAIILNFKPIEELLFNR